MIAAQPPFPFFTDLQGQPLQAGSLYFGVAGQNPETDPIEVFWDAAGTQPALQPIRTINGMPSRSGTPAAVFMDGTDYSLTVKNAAGELVLYAQNAGSISGVALLKTELASSSVGLGSRLVAWIRRATGAVARWVEDKLADTVSVKDYGAVGDGLTDDTAAITVAAASGKTLFWPDGTYKVTSTLVFDTQQRWEGQGATVKMTHSVGYCTPLMWLKPNAFGSRFFGIKFDHNAVGVSQASLSNQLAYAYQSCVLVSADEVFFDDGCRFTNAWDNGLAVGYFVVTGDGSGGSPFHATQTTQAPARVRATNCVSYNCGCGVHSSFGEAGKKGAGFNNLTGIGTQFIGCISISDYNGFTNDYGGGGQALMSGCLAYATAFDAGNPTNGSGISFWIGDGLSILTGCRSYFAGLNGLLSDASCTGLTGDVAIYAPQREGAIFKGNQVNMVVTVDAAGQAAPNTYDAIVIDSSASSISGLALDNVRIRGSMHRWGIYCSGSNGIDGSVNIGEVVGATGLFNYDPDLGHNLAVSSTYLNRFGFGCADPTFEVEALGDTTDYLVQAVGDSAGNGSFAVGDRRNRNNRIAFGYDHDNDVGVIQAITAGVLKRPLLMNPSGGDVMVSSGSWADGCMRMGDYRLWVDSAGRVRIKDGAPSGDTDGAVVGSQS